MIDMNTIPTEVMEAATTVSMYAKIKGWKDWELGDVADRNLVYKLRLEIKELKRVKE